MISEVSNDTCYNLFSTFYANVDDKTKNVAFIKNGIFSFSIILDELMPLQTEFMFKCHDGRSILYLTPINVDSGFSIEKQQQLVTDFNINYTLTQNGKIIHENIRPHVSSYVINSSSGIFKFIGFKPVYEKLELSFIRIGYMNFSNDEIQRLNECLEYYK